MSKNLLNGPRITHTSSDTKLRDDLVILRSEFIITNALPQDIFFCRLSLDGFAPFAEAQAQFYGKLSNEKHTLFEIISTEGFSIE